MSLSKHTRTAIFQYFPFQKRQELSRRVPLFRNLNSSLPFRFKYVTISDFAPNSTAHFELDGAFFWSISDSAEHGVQLTFRSALQRFETVFDEKTRRNEVLEHLVHFFLKRNGTEIGELRILNHPYGLETCFPLRIRHFFRWNCQILFERYDYSTWFGAVRDQRFPVEKVEIEVQNRADLLIFSEELIIQAPVLTIKSRVELPIQAILKLKTLRLKLKTWELSREHFLAICQQWSQKPAGSFFELKVNTAREFNALILELSTNLKVSSIPIAAEDGTNTITIRVEVLVSSGAHSN